MLASDFLLITLPLTLARPTVLLAERDIETCGDASYNITQYTCYDTGSGYTLCPISNERGVYELCGTDKCYSPLEYYCEDGALQQPSVWTGDFSLNVVAPLQDYDGAIIQANGGHLVLGGNSSSYCPDVVPEDDCPNQDDTNFSGDWLAVEVPGGQQVYTTTDGLISYTEPHSSSMNDLLYEGFGTAYSDAGFVAPNGTDWLACPFPDGSEDKHWRLVANVPGTALAFAGCNIIFLQVNNKDQDDLSAWEYLGSSEP